MGKIKIKLKKHPDDKKNIVVIIPARGGSVFLNKNIINCMGKLIVAHSIEYAKESNLVKSIYVSKR